VSGGDETTCVHAQVRHVHTKRLDDLQAPDVSEAKQLRGPRTQRSDRFQPPSAVIDLGSFAIAGHRENHAAQ
jgi:hypothetical protein